MTASPLPDRPALEARRVDVEFDENRVDRLFDSINQCQLPGAAIGLAIHGKPVYCKGFGLSSMDLPAVNSPTTRFRVGSMTKHFTSLLFLLLCDDGLAELDDPIGKYLPEIHRVSHKATMRQLMTHTSGLRDAQDMHWQFDGVDEPLSQRDIIDLYARIEDVNGAPGEAWSYNNGAYVLLGAAIERITRQPLADAMRRRVFIPAGMRDSMLRPSDREFATSSAALHTHLAGPRFERRSLGSLYGDGGVVSTVCDLLSWARNFQTPVVGTPQIWRVMSQPQLLKNGFSTDYGLGLRRQDFGSLRAISAPGGVLGGNAQLITLPAAGIDVVVLVNRSDLSSIDLATHIVEACVPAAVSRRLAADGPLAGGVFKSQATGRIVLLQQGETGQIAVIDGFELPVAPDDNGSFRSYGGLAHMKQVITLVGDPTTPSAIVLDDYGNIDRLSRLSADPPDDPYSVAGVFRAPTTGSEISIDITHNGATATFAGRYGKTRYELTCLSRGVWRAGPVNQIQGGILLFDEHRTKLMFSSRRTRNLEFTRDTS